MADDQEQIRQHWKELAVQLGLEPAGLSTTPAVSTSREEAAPSPRLVPAERAEPPEDKTIPEERQNQEARSSDVETAPGKAPDANQFVGVTEASGTVGLSAEATADERPERRGRRGRRPEKGERERSPRRRRESELRRREEAPVSDSEDLQQTNDPEVSSTLEISEEPEPTFVEDNPSADNRREDNESDTDD